MGGFPSANGVPTRRIAKWDGSAGSELSGGLLDERYCLEVFDDGSGGGPALYVGGGFEQAGTVPANCIEKWDGTSWSPLGAGITGSFPTVESMAVFDDGSGSGAHLYAAGFFWTGVGGPADSIARWDGATWSAVGGGTSSGNYDLAVFDDGSGGGPALFAGGIFSTAGGASALRLAKWDGSTWSSLGGAPDDDVKMLQALDDGFGHGTVLFVGGEFDFSPTADAFVTRWGGCPVDAPIAYCFGDGSGSACPCANAGGPGEGCANSGGGGASFTTLGSTSVAVDDILYIARDLRPNQPALLFVGDERINGGDGVPFGDGLRCSGVHVVRLGVRVPDASGGATWGPGLALQQGFAPGDARRFQVWYRDPANGPCGSGFNLTNGVEVTFQQ